MNHDPRRIARHYRYRKVIWPAQAPFWIAGALVIPFEMFARIALVGGLLYSLYANWAGDAGVEQGAEARFPEEEES